MNQVTAEVHLKRALGLITDVEKATEEFRRSAVERDAQLDADQPFLQMMVTGFRGKRQLAQQKSALLRDLQLANDELDRAAALNRDASIETKDGIAGIKNIRAMIPYLNGQLELFSGGSLKAKQLFANAIQLVDFPDAHYMLGLIYEDEYKPAEALKEFEKCLELEPDGELSVPALREANGMRNYKKKFRGNWLAFVILLFFPIPLLFGVLYFLAKRK